MNDLYTYLKIAAKTDVGRVRDHNEDTIGFSLHQGWCCVADGMGGEQAGDMASQTTMQLIEEQLASLPDEPGVNNLEKKKVLLEQALTKANARIRAYVRKNEMSQSGTTVAMLAFDAAQPARALMLHAGDSRVYRLRGDGFKQLTIDHSVAAAAGVENEDDIPLLFRGVVTQAVGIKSQLQFDLEEIDIEAGDLYLICSDGLTGFVKDAVLADLLNGADPNDLEATTSILIDIANQGGGKDNISAALVYIDHLPEQPDANELRTVVVPDDEELEAIRAEIEAEEAEEEDSSPSSVPSTSNSSDLLANRTQSTDLFTAPGANADEPTTQEVAENTEESSSIEEVAHTTREATSHAAPQKKASPLKWVGLAVGLVAMAAVAYVISTRPSAGVAEQAPPAPPIEQPVVVEAPAPSVEPVVDETAIKQEQVNKLNDLYRSAKEEGAWGALAEFMDSTGLTLGETQADAREIAESRKWTAIWNTLKQDPGLAQRVYDSISIHAAQMTEMGVEWETTPVASPALSTEGDIAADQVCRAIRIFRADAPAQLEKLSTALRSSLMLFSFERESVIPYLQTFYQAKSPIGNMNALRQTRSEAQMANKQLNDFQSLVKQSPSAYLQPSSTPDFAAPAFTRETRNLLSEISSLANRANFETATKLFEAQLSGTKLAPTEQDKGHALLQAVYDSFDALSLHRINHPLSAQPETQWLSLETCEAYRAHFFAVKNFVTWNRSAIVTPPAP